MKNIKISTAISVFALPVFSFSQFTTVEMEGNLIVKDDPSTVIAGPYERYIEGNVVAQGNFFLADHFDPLYHSLAGRGNILSVNDNWANIQYVENSMVMGGGLVNGKSVIAFGNSQISNSSYSIIFGDVVNNYINDIHNSIFFGNQSPETGIQDSVVIRSGNTSAYYGGYKRSLSIGKISNMYNWITDSLTLGEITLWGAENSFLSGTVDLSSAYNLVYHSFVMGRNVKVKNNNASHSFVFGSGNVIEDIDLLFNDSQGRAADHVFTFGKDNSVKCRNNYSFGTGLITDSQYSLTIGRYNKSQEIDYSIYGYNNPFDQELVSPHEPVFVVGNGTSDSNRSNALVVTRKGDAELSGEFKADKVVVKKAAGGIPMGSFGRD